MNKKRLMIVLVLFVLCGRLTPSWAEQRPVDNRLMPTGQTISPAGELITFNGRPVDACLSHDGRLLFVKDRSLLRIIDVKQFRVIQSLDCPGGCSLFGIAADVSGKVYVTNAGQSLHVFAPVAQDDDSLEQTPQYKLKRTIDLPAGAFPCGLAITSDSNSAFICLSKLNKLAVVDLASGRLTKMIDVGVAPFGVALSEDSKRICISSIGGRRATDADTTATSAGTPTVVDKRGIASTGLLSVIDLGELSVVRDYPTGRHPSAVRFLSGGKQVVCANSNDDTLTLIDFAKSTFKEIVIKPTENLPFGSMPSALAVNSRTDEVFVAMAGNNAVAISTRKQLDETKGGELIAPLRGLLPTGWFPSAVVAGDEYLFVACTKGLGSRADIRPTAKGRNSHDHLGLVQRIALTDLANDDRLSKMSKVARASAKLNPVTKWSRAKENLDSTTVPQPIPKRLGDPSLFKHVIYVIKENRTYDQVFGDFADSRAEKSLCVFPEKLSPNHHALARRFGILDNYYCNGVLSADGHSWATEGNVTPYLERAFGGFARSYTFGDDPITYSSSGFIWDHLLDAGLSFRNYGEMDYATPPAGYNLLKILEARDKGEHLEFGQKIGIERLRRYSCRNYPGWNMEIPDVLRMDRFLEEFNQFKENGELPNLSIVYLPQDHFGGPVTSSAHMADNDLAIGRLVEAVSKSEYWKNTVIFINEDDPQNGYDHIDGHRSICLVVSAYSRSGVNHDFFNQNSVLRTILHIFGLPPMNQQNAVVPVMASCFQNQSDMKPYKAIIPETPLNQQAKPVGQQSELERRWRRILTTVPIERTGMKTEKDEDNLNRFVWHEQMGWNTAYPTEYAGPHAKGLKQLGLSLDLEALGDDD